MLRSSRTQTVWLKQVSPLNYITCQKLTLRDSSRKRMIKSTRMRPGIILSKVYRPNTLKAIYPSNLTNSIARDNTKNSYKASAKISFRNSFRTSSIKVIKRLKAWQGTMMMRQGLQESQTLRNKMIPTLMLVQLYTDIRKVFWTSHILRRIWLLSQLWADSLRRWK